MKDIVLYDQKCRFCKATKRVFEKLDWMNAIEWIPLQEADSTRFTEEELLREIHLITPNGSAKKRLLCSSADAYSFSINWSDRIDPLSSVFKTCWACWLQDGSGQSNLSYGEKERYYPIDNFHA